MQAPGSIKPGAGLIQTRAAVSEKPQNLRAENEGKSEFGVWLFGRWKEICEKVGIFGI